MKVEMVYTIFHNIVANIQTSSNPDLWYYNFQRILSSGIFSSLIHRNINVWILV